jgi:hypothetical protein
LYTVFPATFNVAFAFVFLAFGTPAVTIVPVVAFVTFAAAAEEEALFLPDLTAFLSVFLVCLA